MDKAKRKKFSHFLKTNIWLKEVGTLKSIQADFHSPYTNSLNTFILCIDFRRDSAPKIIAIM